MFRKAGNIAQVRNCIEYDFVPNELNISQTTLSIFSLLAVTTILRGTMAKAAREPIDPIWFFWMTSRRMSQDQRAIHCFLMSF